MLTETVSLPNANIHMHHLATVVEVRGNTVPGPLIILLVSVPRPHAQPLMV